MRWGLGLRRKKQSFLGQEIALRLSSQGGIAELQLIGLKTASQSRTICLTLDPTILQSSFNLRRRLGSLFNDCGEHLEATLSLLKPKIRLLKLPTNTGALFRCADKFYTGSFEGFFDGLECSYMCIRNRLFRL